jgi:DNA polymerase-3 subunit beta
VQITCNQENLNKGLTIAGRAVATRTTLPILLNVLLATEGDHLRLAATNLEWSVTCRVPGMIESEGDVTIPGRLLSDLVGSLGSDQAILLVTSGASLKVSSKGFVSNLRGIAATEFPEVPVITADTSCLVETVNGSVLQEALQQVAFAAADDDARPTLAGVRCEFTSDALNLAAADGFRLAMRSIPLTRNTPEQVASVIVPVRAIQELTRLLTDWKEVVSIMVTNSRSQIIFRIGTTELVSRLIEGTFPDVAKVVPTTWRRRLTLNTKDFSNANKIASLVAKDANNIVRLNIKKTDDKATINVNAQSESGDSDVVVDTTIEGELQELKIAFSGKFLAEAIGAIKTNQFTLDLIGASNPGVMRPVSKDDYVQVLMPMSIGDKTS